MLEKLRYLEKGRFEIESFYPKEFVKFEEINSSLGQFIEKIAESMVVPAFEISQIVILENI